MRETVSEKIRQNFIAKSSPNLFWQEIRQIYRAQSRNSRYHATKPLNFFIYGFLRNKSDNQDHWITRTGLPRIGQLGSTPRPGPLGRPILPPTSSTPSILPVRTPL